MDIITPTLRTIDKIVRGNDNQTKSILAAGAWPLLVKLLVHIEINIVNAFF
jgi:hypothetical protein